jgi:molybdate transport system substrate-binding protein
MASISVLSSMATRQLLAELLASYTHHSELKVTLESVGGVDAARRVRAGELFDVVVLAGEAIDALQVSGKLAAGSKQDLVHSGVAVAVRSGSAWPDIRSQEALRQTVLAAHSIGYSTGPSGVALLKLFESWGITAQIQMRLVQAPAGIPVATLVARGDVALGFQQLSELLHQPGIQVLGPLPEAIQIVTTFSGALGTHCAHSPLGTHAREVLEFLASAATAGVKQRHGMLPARTP